LRATLAALTLASGFAVAQDTSSDKGKLSYALGYQLGREAAESGELLDLNTMTRAVQDGYAKKEADGSCRADAYRL
jgi:peptidylprolyl isomerase